MLFFKIFVDFVEKRNKNDEIFNRKGVYGLEDDIVTFYKDKSKNFYFEYKESRENLEKKLNNLNFFNNSKKKIKIMKNKI